MKITNENILLEAIERLHNLGPNIVVISSSTMVENQEIITLYASNRKENQQVKVDIPKITKADGSGVFTGTGDLLTAMLVAQTSNQALDFPSAIERAVNILRCVLLKSVEIPLQGTNEINIIAARKEILEPRLDLKVVQVNRK